MLKSNSAKMLVGHGDQAGRHARASLCLRERCDRDRFPGRRRRLVICFEWLQRPENVLAGYCRWPDYRSANSPTAIWIDHRKTGARVPHPLEEMTENGPLLFYPEAEAVLAKVPRRGIPIVLSQYRDGTVKPWNSMRLGEVVRGLSSAWPRPSRWTPAGMTELEEAGAHRRARPRALRPPQQGL
jgi:hypothetical protein